MNKRAGTDAGPGPGPAGPSRLLLARIVHEGAIWSVYVATTPQSGEQILTQLEFEGKGVGRTKERYARPVDGELLDALHNGTPVSRASLAEQLELAVRGAE